MRVYVEGGSMLVYEQTHGWLYEYMYISVCKAAYVSNAYKKQSKFKILLSQHTRDMLIAYSSYSSWLLRTQRATFFLKLV